MAPFTTNRKLISFFYHLSDSISLFISPGKVLLYFSKLLIVIHLDVYIVYYLFFCLNLQ